MPSGRAWPRISIVTPAFNQGAYIEETILSVLHQGYPSVEHIVMDGGSTDGTLAVLERYRERLAHCQSEPDNGQSHAINKGMALATGEILTWLNSDDMLAPGALAAVALAFDTNQADMVAGICRMYRDGELVAQHITSCAEGPLPLDDLLDLDGGWNAGQFFYQPEVMFTRELWQRAGGYVNDWLHYSMDYEMWLRFAEAGARLHVIGRPVAWFRMHAAQKTHVAARFQAELLVCREDFLRQRGREFTAPEARPSRNRLRITMLNDIGPFYGAGIAHVRMARALAWAGHELSLVSILDRSILGIESTALHVGRGAGAGGGDAAGPGDCGQSACRRGGCVPGAGIVRAFPGGGGDARFLERDRALRVPGAVREVPGRVRRDVSDGGRVSRPGAGADCGRVPEEAPDSGRRAGAVAAGEFGVGGGVARRALAAGPDDLARQAPVAQFGLSFPLDVFRPRDAMLCRELLGLPADKFIVLLPGGVGDPRKGAMAFLEALGRLGLPDLLVATLGREDPSLRSPVEVRQLGQINAQLRVAMANSAADLVVAPSVVETFGQTVVEAIACGTPALGYAVPGTCEAIRDGVTGLLAEGGPDGLAAAVQYLYARPEARRELASWGRLYVENEWSEFAASRRLYLALRAVDADGRIGLGRNLRFRAEAPALPAFQTVAQCRETWRPCQGLSQMEYPLPQYGLGPFRWAYGPGAVVELFAAEAGLHRVLMTYRNVAPNQHVELRCNGVEWGGYPVPVTGFGSSRFLVANLMLEPGSNLLHMRFRVWDTG